jgi:peptidoglycan/LPS O-acetylase OafA/YrhL
MSGTADPPTSAGSAEAVQPPRDVILAVWLMYAGAALTALLGLLRAIDPDAYDDALDTSSGTSARGSYVVFLFLVAAVWLLVARYCGRGSRRARRGATFFAVLYVAAVVGAVVIEPRLDLYNVVSVLIAVVAAAVVWLLYRPDSRHWFLRTHPPTS